MSSTESVRAGFLKRKTDKAAEIAAVEGRKAEKLANAEIEEKCALLLTTAKSLEKSSKTVRDSAGPIISSGRTAVAPAKRTTSAGYDDSKTSFNQAVVFKGEADQLARDDL